MRRRTKVSIIAGAILGAGAVAAFFAVPWYVERRVVEEAAARHVALAVGGVRVRFGSVALEGLTATSSDVPGATLTADRVDVALDGLRPTDVRVDRAKVALSGDVAVVLPALDRLAQAQPAGGGGGGPALRVHFEDASVDWQGASGPNSVVRLGSVKGDLGGAPLGSEGSVTAIFTFEVGAAKVGPWPVSHARDAKAITTTFVLSPKGEAAASLRFSHAPDWSASSVDAKVATMTRLLDLGLPEPLLSTYAIEGVALKVDLHHEETKTTGRGVIRDLAIRGARLRSAAAPLDLALTASYEGPRERMPLTSGSISVGPFTGPLTGAIGRPPDGVTCELASTSKVMSCSDALRKQTESMTGPDVAAGLDALARLVGADKAVGGDVQVTAEISVDTRSLSKARLRITPSASCDLSFLPR